MTSINPSENEKYRMKDLNSHDLNEVVIAQPSKKSEDEVSKDKKEEEEQSIPYHQLFRYAEIWDILLILVGTISATIHGAGLPVMFLFFGDLTTSFTEFGIYEQCNFNYTQCTAAGLFNGSEQSFNDKMLEVEDLEKNSIQFVYYFVYIACAVLVCATLQVSTWSLQAVRQGKKIRVTYFRSILRQDMGFHDLNSAGELNVRLSEDVKKIEEGIGDKVSITIQYVSMTLSGLIIAFVYSWKLALVTLAAAPLVGISSSLFFTVSAKFTKLELSAYARAGGIADESISAIRTVVAFGCQSKEVNRYTANLHDAKIVGIKKAIASGASIGFLYLTMFGMYALSFWYGTILVIDEEIEVGDMMTTFFCILIAAFALGSAGGNMGAFSSAKVAGAKLFEVIDNVPEIDIYSNSGLKPDLKGAIEFENVRFHYPSRTDVEILKNVSFTVDVGKTVALVGQSGCGKSTSVQLIQRFYDAIEGKVKIDGNDIKDLNVRHLRDNIAVVAQEPVLFSTTIAENISWGREGVSHDEIVQATKQANAYDFIMKLPKGFQTMVGEGGGQLSGGQKQRVAIARAIIRDPKIMLLDEATSALDTESESIVQSALEKASAGRTTIVIAHRLSTVINSDKILTFSEGEVVEQGTHTELLQIPNGVYSNLVKMQIVNQEDKDGEVDGTESIKNGGLVKNDSIRKRTFSSASSIHDKKSRSSLRRRTSNSSHVEEEEEEEEFEPVGAMKILQLNKPEWPLIALGCFFAAVAGCVDPLNAVIFSKILVIFTLDDETEQRSEAVFYACMFLVLGGTAMIAFTLEASLFGKSGMELTTRLRSKTFHAMLRQDMSYFDDFRHSTGALCTRLSADASRVQGATGVRLGTMLKNFFSLGVALGISFAFGWQLTLLTLAFVPFMAVGGFIEMTLLIGESESEKKAYEEAGKISSQAINNIKTVASLTRENTIFELYSKEIAEPVKNAYKKSLFHGIGYGYSQCVIYFAYAAVFRFGIELVQNGSMEFQDVFLVLTAVIFGAMAVGQNSSFAPDYAEAKVSSARIFHLLDSTPEIDAYSTEGIKPNNCSGKITFGNVKFFYLTRPDMLVLKDLSFTAEAGNTVALVGQSGCGKSTCVQLIERFYDPDKGDIHLDGNKMSDLNVSWLRQQIGIVSQEPVLFDQSIRENILYGDVDGQHTEEEVKDCARKANIHDFIETLPNGYNTNVGAKGGQLSGGQKQRVAIARALLRNPKLLLLDEATSALDAESEKVVQQALDTARQGRTSIVIAHRLTTIKDADLICVVDNGEIVESGTHDQLIAKGAAYYSLVNAQISKQD